MRTNVIGPSLVVVLAATAALSLSAQRGPAPLSTVLYDYHAWTTEQLSKPGSLGDFGNYSLSVQRRGEAGAVPEIHDVLSHILMFTSGEGNLVVGGEIVDGPDGKKMIRGGESHKIAPGVVYHIPIKVAHWVLPNAGNAVTYFVTNICADNHRWDPVGLCVLP